ncbi:hypothetical protein FNV43_RR12880 [Rhamnella rubrinervis]|uniref:Uncharacterized protein n=1 Tax=Rhamnella rubrinervis TaxID=2594499 RepID=A0A8K0H035_9ROSA|nr:hypothetical protein FNV43_RR12880 [Rhamnella rubrinervis]
MLARDSRLIATVMLRKCKEVFEDVKSLGPQNLAFLAGDMFQAIPPANTVLLKMDRDSYEAQLYMDMLMMVMQSGQERNKWNGRRSSLLQDLVTTR